MSRTSVVDVALLILRLAGLGLALAHGLPKLMGLAMGQGGRFIEAVSNLGFPMPGLFAWAAALAETVGGLFVALGLFTRIAAALAAFSMLVAAFGRHHAHDLLLVKLGIRHASEEAMKAWGNPELALLYVLPLSALALTGPGALAVGRLLGKGSRRG